MAALLIGSSFLGILKGACLILSFLSSIVLIVVVLMREPDGGGLANAFGGEGGRAFGVDDRGGNRIIAFAACLLMVSAILYASIRAPGDPAHLEWLDAGRAVPSITSVAGPGSPGATAGAGARILEAAG